MTNSDATVALNNMPMLAAFIALAGVLLGSIITGFYGLWTRHKEYVNGYYKNIVSRRIRAYEQLESVIGALEPLYQDNDGKIIHFALSNAESIKSLMESLSNIAAQGLWIEHETFKKARKLNNTIKAVMSFPPELTPLRPPQNPHDPKDLMQIMDYAKDKRDEISQLRSALASMVAKDMLTLHDVKAFLKRKKKQSST
jgi:hypothetical protein